MDEQNFYKEAFARNIGILTQVDQDKLKNLHVAIVGAGGVGGVYSHYLARTGVGKITIADPDTFERVNINRQIAAGTNTFGKKKVDVVEAMIKDINPYATVRKFPEGISSQNADIFFEGVDVVIDGIDFLNIRGRLLFFKKAREHGAYAITAAPVGFGTSIIVFSPTGMTFEDYFSINESMSDFELCFMFGLGLTPRLVQMSYLKPENIDFSGKTSSPSLGISTLLCANVVICEIIKIVQGKKIKAAPFSYQFDPYVGKRRTGYLRRGNKGLIQMFKRWFAIKKYKLPLK